jgi:NADH:ubiquinone oxidoreductase subunit E
MLSVVVCVGSSCYVRGSERLADALGKLVCEHGVDASVELTGAFCMDQCSMGVSVQVGERVHRCVDAGDAVGFFDREVMPWVRISSEA